MHRHALIALLLIVACGEPSLRATQAPPALGALTILAQRLTPDSFPISSAVGLDDCSMLVADSRFGRLAELDNGAVRIVAQGPSAWRFLHLQPIDAHRVIVWSSTANAYLALFDRQRGALTPLPMPPSQWGGPTIGPLVGLGGDAYAVIPIGNPYAMRREPDARPSVPDVEIHRLNGETQAQLGVVTERGGHYLTWRGARAAIGRADQTILVLRYADATLVRYRPDRTDTVALARYYEPPPIREELRHLPWIQIPDELSRIIDAPAVQTAAFAPDGRVYVVRNYRFAWRTYRDAVFGPAGAWVPISQGLEVYDPNGMRLGAYALPPGGVEWLSADARGRLFLAQATRLLIIRDPTRQRADPKCFRAGAS